MRFSTPQVLFREAYETVRDANAVLPFMDGAFIEEFFARVRAIGEAIVQENRWTERDLARMFSAPDMVLNVKLGEGSIAEFEEFKAWFSENGTIEFYA